ncbi:paxillin isoform X2 [Macrosteles quadrilineatus]|uniref:paxillin isoform X2 n=1 Tax=Macrosteles quadrilineatus TaxID=74068 RepID=UPI0023E20E7D|nr:paxillin isoform X2 [Macrosteles quadrilineatus]
MTSRFSPSPPPRTNSRTRMRRREWDSHFNALLADLQNTISPSGSGYGSLNGHTTRSEYATVNSRTRSPTARPMSPMYQNEGVTSSSKMTTSLNNNLSELDTLLQDLSNSRYSERRATDMNGTLGLGRPSVDSLLDELNTAVPPQSKPSSGSNKDADHYVHEVIIKETTTTGRPTASSATKELDDLMASLSDFKVSSSPATARYTETTTTITESAYAKPSRSKQKQLDCMLGSLQADMSRQGVNTTQKGCCSACDKPIVGQVITALGKTWHPEHFVCTHCQQELGTRNFFERDAHPYCEPDYHNLFSPRCAYCNGPILDKCVTALEKTWHTEHFFCAQCGKQFGEEGFHEREGKPYCRDDYFDLFAPKCGGCNRPIMENYVSALSSQWHADCFVCRDCRQPFHGGSFFDHEGLPYCETHYHAKRGSLCAGCHKPITGRCITAMFRKFHPEHFVCAFCLKQLNKGTFKEQNDKPYCHSCFEKLFG